ncbi:hypothetical protein AgCh_012380 [Apium graveolens]
MEKSFKKLFMSNFVWVVTSGRQLVKSLELQSLNDMGFSKRYQSPDGDVVECVLSHLELAFDHPLLKGQKPLEPPERPKHNESIDFSTEVIQAWMNTSESCPEGTIPIRKTTEQDVLRASSVRRFGKKVRRRDTTSNDHEVDSLLSFKIR